MIDKNELYEKYYSKVYAYLFAAVKNLYISEDLASEVFLKIYRKLDTYDETKSAISTWIYNITKNTLYDYYRTNHPTSELDEDMPEDLEDSSAHEDELKSLAQALQKLDESERNIIVGKYYRRKTLKDIACELGVSYFRVCGLHKKGLKKLKEIMQADTNF